MRVLSVDCLWAMFSTLLLVIVTTMIMSRWCWVLLVLSSAVQGTNAVFFEEPSPAVVAENDTAVFRCRVSSGLPGWAVNGTFTSSVLNPDIEEHSGPASNGGPPIQTLSIVARRVYNGTIVQCFVFPDNVNSSATMLIQGPLSAVPELAAAPQTDSILFSWAAPFSLDLTNTEPDITYCVDVFTSEGTELVASGCGLTETSYSFTADVRSPCDAFTAVVTPVNGAGNGSTAAVEGYYLMEAPILNGNQNVTYAFVNGTQAQRLAISVGDMPSVPVCTCELVFTSIDSIYPALELNITNLDCQSSLSANSIIVDTTTTPSRQSAVVLDRIYLLEVVLHNFAGSAVFTPNILSTHALQDLRKTTSQNRTWLEVTFIDNTVAPGCILIIVDGEVEYVFVWYLPTGSVTHNLMLLGLVEGSYIVAGYDLEDNTTPGRYVARNITVTGSTERMNVASNVDIEGAVKSNSILIHLSGNRMVCAQCSDITVTQCLLVLHPVGDLTEIETLYVQRNEESCTQVRNSGEYHIASFGVIVGDDSQITQLTTLPVPFTVPTAIPSTSSTAVPDGGKTNSFGIVVGTLLSAIVLIVSSTTLLIAIICIYKMGRRAQATSTIQVKHNSAYEFRKIRHRLAATNTTQPPPATGGGGSVEMSSNTAYETHTLRPPTRAIARADSSEPPHVYETVY